VALGTGRYESILVYLGFKARRNTGDTLGEAPGRARGAGRVETLPRGLMHGELNGAQPKHCFKATLSRRTRLEARLHSIAIGLVVREARRRYCFRR